MKKLFEKKEVLFAVIFIAIYVFGASTAENISENTLVSKALLCAVGAVISAVLVIFSSKNGLNEYLGLCGFHGNAADMLYFIPLIVICSVNLWFGLTMKMNISESVAYVISMIFVGFLEELLFRGLLFRAMCKSSVKTAFIVSSLTFGIGHIVNLLNGRAVFETVNQIIYATAVGFVFTAIAYYGKSLIPTIIAHITINSLSAFAYSPSGRGTVAATAVFSAICIAYGIYIVIRCGKTERAAEHTA